MGYKIKEIREEIGNDTGGTFGKVRSDEKHYKRA